MTTLMYKAHIATPLRSIVLGLTLFAVGPALACRCIEPGDAAAYRGAHAIVLANVVQVSGNPVGLGGAIAVLVVDKAWKSAVADRIQVETSTTCGYVFETGKEYLVYLRAGGAGTPYSTSKCMGNRPLAEAQERLHWLERKGKPAAVSWVNTGH